MLTFSCLVSFYHMLGSDGTVSLWDKDARTRMKSKPPSPYLVGSFRISSPRLGVVLVRSSFTAHPIPSRSPLDQPRGFPLSYADAYHY